MAKSNKNINCIIYARLSQEDGYDSTSVSIEIRGHTNRHNKVIVQFTMSSSSSTSHSAAVLLQNSSHAGA